MDELKKVIAANISTLRREAGMTQLDLANKLNYSDKAVSKWESGASVPDVGVLLEIANLFGVTVDYLLSEDHKIPVKAMMRGTMKSRKNLVITLLAVAAVWLVCTLTFVIAKILGVWDAAWLLFIWAIPASCIVLIIFNSIWSSPRKNYLYITLLMWTMLAGIYLTMLPMNLWLIFTVGIPGQIIIVLWSSMKKQ